MTVSFARRASYLVLLVFGWLSLTVGAAGQDPLPPSPPAQEKPGAQARPRIPLKVTVVISRFQGEKADKRVGSLPFTLLVNTNDDGTQLNMRTEVAVPTSTLGTTKEGASAPMTTFQYKPLGTSISCSAGIAEGGRYLLRLGISDSQIFVDPTAAKGLPPANQQFSSQASLLLRDGETVQYTTASDKSSGEVIKVDVTLNVVK